ncbi:MAG: hypothetical protein QHH14_05420 [Clostridiales bacterium]|nr:hypothetical protein [Clostridiales bacterium]
MIFQSHLLSMVIYAFFVSVVLALVRKNELKSQVKYGLSLFLIMVIGGLAFGWFMFLFAR